MKPAVERRTVVVEGRRIRYRVTGTGPQLVLVHGLAASLRWWAPIVPALSARHTVYLVNLPGFGTLFRHGRALSVAEAAGWLRSWLTELSLAPVDLAGHSMGGAIALRLAIDDPQLVNRLVLVDAAVFPSVSRLVGYAVPLLHELRTLRPGFLPLLLADALRAGPRSLFHAAGDLVHLHVDAELSTLDRPTLLVWGEHDALVPLAIGRRLLAALPNARLELVPGVGHVPMDRAPDVVTRAILTFLDSADSSIPTGSGGQAPTRLE
jgi:pimeloyl-ACP methyl ester carboxylesterase